MAAVPNAIPLHHVVLSISGTMSCRCCTGGSNPPWFRKFTRPAWFSSPQDQVKGEDDSDVVDRLDDEEALEFTYFDPTVNDDNTWDAGVVINAFLGKHFSWVITPEVREAIMTSSSLLAKDWWVPN